MPKSYPTWAITSLEKWNLSGIKWYLGTARRLWLGQVYIIQGNEFICAIYSVFFTDMWWWHRGLCRLSQKTAFITIKQKGGILDSWRYHIQRILPNLFFSFPYNWTIWASWYEVERVQLFRLVISMQLLWTKLSALKNSLIKVTVISWIKKKEKNHWSTIIKVI